MKNNESDQRTTSQPEIDQRFFLRAAGRATPFRHALKIHAMKIHENHENHGKSSESMKIHENVWKTLKKNIEIYENLRDTLRILRR